jgi:hypothetical protein
VHQSIKQFINRRFRRFRTATHSGAVIIDYTTSSHVCK